MNENIQKILDEVGGYGTKALLHPDDIEKFAMLVIGECLKIAENEQSIYANLRKNTFDFGMKNIYAEGETATEVIINNIKKLQVVKIIDK